MIGWCFNVSFPFIGNSFSNFRDFYFQFLVLLVYNIHLNEPKNNTKAKEQIKEHARVSIQEKLKAMQKQVREEEQKRDVPIRKKNMEL